MSPYYKCLSILRKHGHRRVVSYSVSNTVVSRTYKWEDDGNQHTITDIYDTFSVRTPVHVCTTANQY